MPTSVGTTAGATTETATNKGANLHNCLIYSVTLNNAHLVRSDQNAPNRSATTTVRNNGRNRSPNPGQLQLKSQRPCAIASLLFWK